MQGHNNRGGTDDSDKGNTLDIRCNTCFDGSYSLARSYFDSDQYLRYFRLDFLNLCFDLHHHYFPGFFHLAMSYQALFVGDLRSRLKVVVAETRLMVVVVIL